MNLLDIFTENEKIGGMPADKFDAAMARLKQRASQGPLKTVWDPVKRVYKNVPVNPPKAGMTENAEGLNVGDDVIITGNVEFQGKTGVIDSFGQDNRFVVVNLYNHGRHSFHSSDVSVNHYADSDEEEADNRSGVAEAKGLKKRVRIVKGPEAGKTGTIGEVRHGAYKGAPKTFTVDIDGGGSIQLPKEALRLLKDQSVAEGTKLVADGSVINVYYNGTHIGNIFTSTTKDTPYKAYSKHWDMSRLFKSKKAATDWLTQTHQTAIKEEAQEQGMAEVSLNEFASEPSDGGDDDEYDLLVKLVKMWWLGDERQHAKAAQTLASMGIDIDEDDPNIILRRGTQFLEFPMDDFQPGVAEATGDERFDTMMSKIGQPAMQKAQQDRKLSSIQSVADAMCNNLKCDYDDLTDQDLEFIAGEAGASMYEVISALGRQKFNAKRNISKWDDEDINEQVMAEGFNAEYDDEAGMAHTNLHTIARSAQGLLDTINDEENLPEWVQEKIVKAQAMLSAAWDYLKSQEEQGIDPRMGMNEMSGVGGVKPADLYRQVQTFKKPPATERPVPQHVQYAIDRVKRDPKYTLEQRAEIIQNLISQHTIDRKIGEDITVDGRALEAGAIVYNGAIGVGEVLGSDGRTVRVRSWEGRENRLAPSTVRFVANLETQPDLYTWKGRPQVGVLDRLNQRFQERDQALAEQHLAELSFLGSECTKDCSGHRAGYNWSHSKGLRQGNSPYSPSFNKGAALAVAGK